MKIQNWRLYKETADYIRYDLDDSKYETFLVISKPQVKGTGYLVSVMKNNNVILNELFQTKRQALNFSTKYMRSHQQ